jgi:multidrug efflux pump subunit AcrA (membrane-fusion protein)
VTPGVAIATIYSVDRAEVRLPLPDRELAYLDFPLSGRVADQSGGSSASGATGGSFSTEVILRGEFAGAMRTWRGHIVRTEGELDPQSRMVHMVAQVEDPYGRRSDDAASVPLPVGLFVEAEIIGRRVEDVVVIPRSAVRGRDQVLIVDENERLHFRWIEIIKAERELVVVGEGLDDGDRVCLSPIDTPVDGMRVRSVEEQRTPAPSDL